MPVDLAVEAEEPVGTVSTEASFRTAGVAMPVIDGALHDVLRARGFSAATLAWDGSAAGPDGARTQLIDSQGVANLADWLLGFGYGVLSGQRDARASFVPPLPLASDATVFVGGYAHLHEDRPYRSRVARGVVIGVLVAVAIVGVIAVIAASKGDVKFPHLGASVGEAALRALTFPVLVGAQLALDATRVAVDVATRLPPGHVHGWACNPFLGVHAGIAYAPRPGPELRGEARNANVLALSATLVENRSGRILWTAAQPMEIDPLDEKEVRYAVRHLLAGLPMAR
jgi:hypothetical protein